MKAAVIRAHGGLDAVSVEEVPEPVRRPGEVLVAVRACALNHMDLWARKGIPGFSFPLPLIPGCDVAGVVVESDDLAAGTEVVLQPGLSCGYCAACLGGRDNLCAGYGILGETRDGGCAERIVVPRANILPKPPNLTFAEAAAYPLTMLTAWHMLVGRARIQPGETVLVHAAGSGVGSAAVQIARLFGARVCATAGSPEKCARAVALGVEKAIDYRATPDWTGEVRGWTGKRGVDVIIEHVGGETFDMSLRSLATGGRLVTCGATAGGQVGVSLQRIFFKNLSVLGSTMGSKGELWTITGHVAAGRLRPIVDRVLPLGQVREAHAALEGRDVFGKVVVAP